MNFKLLIFIIFLISAIMSYAQIEPIAEEDLPMKVIVSHYENNSETTKWFKITNQNENQFIASFYSSGFKKEIFYNNSGKVQKETTVKNLIPTLLTKYLNQQYDKSKVIEFKFVKNIVDQVAEYEVLVRTKDRDEIIIRFDDQYTPIGISQGYASK